MDMKNRICLITGANSGIGRAAAVELARLGATVVLVCRTPEKGQAAASEIRSESGSSSVDHLAADLSSQASIKNMVAEYKKRYPALHVLLNNAGMAPAKRRLSADGIEMTFAVNHLAYFLLSRLLMESLRAGGSSRIVNVSSEAHRSGVLDFENLQAEKSFSTWGVYSLSKLCNLLFTQELSKRLQGSGVTANALHPGFVSTAIFRETPALLKMFVRGFAMDSRKGAETSVYLASSPEVGSVSGKYFIKKKEAQPADKALDASAAQRLWEISEKLAQAGS